MAKTRTISIGSLMLGGSFPVRIQSMTNTNTMDVTATLKQCIALANAGCELVRITARNKVEAENLRVIKQALIKENIHIPIIADVHFQPEVAELAAHFVDKVRINPGNYVDNKKANQDIEFLEKYAGYEIERIHARVLPLIKICKENGTTLRIGVNQGSISDRILAQYGDTPAGMVASALEFIRVFSSEGFHNLVLSMKSSNVKTMIYAYRLLVEKMQQEGFDYPLHLGVTEAGAGTDARIKSAAGIGALLMEGIGDTIRVSLTENPLNEVPVAQKIVKYFANYRKDTNISYAKSFVFEKRETTAIKMIGGTNALVCLGDIIDKNIQLSIIPDGWIDNESNNILVCNSNIKIAFVVVNTNNISQHFDTAHSDKVIVIDISNETKLPQIRNYLEILKKEGHKTPVIIRKKYKLPHPEELLLAASAEFAYFLADGLINGISISDLHRKINPNEIMFSVLQAMGLRRTKAEFIACPTCGRTSYNVEEALKKITQALSHQKHLKIGVMGCIVNGPGEMADADYGYVGSANKKVNLYKGKIPILKNIDEEKALSALIQLIKEHGDWIDN